MALLTGSMTGKQKKDVRERIAAGEIQVVIGTHALLTDSTRFANLGLVITDEQHRFGVGQRSRLSAKGEDPHLLVMSATPIPRTLALILYGDLDVSILTSCPGTGAGGHLSGGGELPSPDQRLYPQAGGGGTSVLRGLPGGGRKRGARHQGRLRLGGDLAADGFSRTCALLCSTGR